MKKVRQHLRQLLSLTLNTQQIAYVGREADPAFDIEEITGFGAHIVIPRKVAADAIIRYFSEQNRLIHLCSVLFQLDGKGGSGGIIELRGFRPLELALLESGYRFDKELHRFVRTQEERKTDDWGYLKDGEEYRLTFMSIDVVGSSEFIHTNLKVDIENTLRNLHHWLRFFIEAENGRLWYWHGDGGLATFLEENGANGALRSGLKILANLPIFNMEQNELEYENDLRLRIGVHYGTAQYNSDTARIQSEDIQQSILIESRYCPPNTIMASESVFQLAAPEIKKLFTEEVVSDQLHLYRNLKF